MKGDTQAAGFREDMRKTPERQRTAMDELGRAQALTKEEIRQEAPTSWPQVSGLAVMQE